MFSKRNASTFPSILFPGAFWASFLISFLLYSSVVTATQYMNITLQVPVNTTVFDENHELCLPTQWYDVVLFLLGNYVAHAFTVVSKPGEPYQDYWLRTFVALLFPHTGLEDGLKAIYRHACFVGDPLQTAGRAGALVMVVRSPKWRPRPGDVIHGIRFSSEEKQRLQPLQAVNTLQLESGVAQSSLPNDQQSLIRRLLTPTDDHALEATDSSEHQHHDSSEPRLPELTCQRFYKDFKFKNEELQKVQLRYEMNGFIELSDEYHLVYVPDDAEVEPMVSEEKKPRYAVTLSRKWELAKALVAIFQTVYSCITLYRARANQLQQFGYASFGLTVAPYAIMSVVNLLGNAVTPSYAALHLVESHDLREAARRKEDQLEDTVGKLKEGTTDAATFTGTFETIEDAKHIYTMSFKREVSYPGSTTDTKTESYRAQVRVDENAKGGKGFIAETVLTQVHRDSPLRHGLVRYTIRFLVMFAPILINGAISGFQPGNSTPSQRGWTMSWLLVGITSCLGFAYGFSYFDLVDESHAEEVSTLIMVTLFVLIMGIPAIGGVVTVIQMFLQFGACMRVY